MNDSRIAFYGRYIDDCISIVSGTSVESAVSYVDNKVKFDGCQILWEGSALRQNFLDMTVCLNVDGSRQTVISWQPYRKQKNHMERIPWISHHPLDVKKGTFIGELSRLAVLSSDLSTYVVAVKELVSLYLHRGYPENLVTYWVKTHAKVRWEKRFNNNNAEREDVGVLVLKTEFNPVWNWFNAKELGDEILNYWREWSNRAFDTGGITSADIRDGYPRPTERFGDLKDILPELTSEQVSFGYPIRIPDIRKISIIDSKFIVSRKRTRNLFDLTNLWKRSIFQRMERNLPADSSTSSNTGKSVQFHALPVVPELTHTTTQPQPGPSTPQYPGHVFEDEGVIYVGHVPRSDQLDRDKPFFG